MSISESHQAGEPDHAASRPQQEQENLWKSKIVSGLER
jgi:hypothetical protein